MGVGTLIGSKERRSAVVPWTSHLSTGCQPHFFKKTFGTGSSMIRGEKGMAVFWMNRPVGILSYPVPPRPAALPCAALPQPAHGTSGFWTPQYVGNLFVDASEKLSRTAVFFYVLIVNKWSCPGHKSASCFCASVSPQPDLRCLALLRLVLGWMSGFWVRHVAKHVMRECNFTETIK